MVTTRGRERELEILFAAAEAGRSVLVTGPLGAGKSHIISQFLASRRADWYVAHVVASEAASTIPFGAVASMMPDDGASDAFALLRSASDRFNRLASGRRPFVVVDDVHHLDASSTVLVHALCVKDGAVLVAAARDGVAPPAAVSDLFKEVGAERIELGPLADDYLRALAADGLECEPGDPAVDRLLARSGGNPLFLGELVRAHRSRLPGGLSSQLIDLVRARLADLSDAARELLDHVAVGEPLSAGLDVVDDRALIELERSSLVATVLDGHRRVIRCAHPLYGEVVRAELSPTSRKLVAERLAASMRGHQRRRGDALRLAGWLLDQGEVPDPVLACEAASEASAWLQPDLAERLVQIALSADRSYDVFMVAGALRRNAGDVRAAEQWFIQALDVAPGDAEMLEVAVILAQLYGFYDGNPAAAAAVLADVGSRVTEDLHRRELEVEEVVFASLGQHEMVLETASKMLHDPTCDERAQWTALSTALWAEVQLMRLDQVDDHLQRIDALPPEVVHARPGTLDLVWGLEATVRLERGELAAGIAGGEARAREAERDGIPGGLLQFAIGHLSWLCADLAGALAAVHRSVDRLERFDSFNALPMVMSSAAILAAIDGDRDAAAGWLERADELTRGVNPVSPVWRHRARGWMVADDDRDEAAQCFVDASSVGRAGSIHAWALMALHDAVLVGAAERTLGELEMFKMLPVEAPFMSLLIDHCTARASLDAERISACAERFEAAGATWHAANAWAGAALAEESDVAKTRAATRAMMLSPRSALLVGADEITDLALSPRQLEVAVLAATGSASRAIAESMFVSTRTVDNHLRSVYRRLGVDGRAGLNSVLSLGGGGGHRMAPTPAGG